MNLLIFVSTLLMIVGILTYARIENYRDFSIMQSQFENYMNKVERKFINSQNSKIYDDTVATKKEGEKVEKEKAINADSKLTFIYFVDKEKKSSKDFAQYHLMAKKLMQFLYSHTDFYKMASEKKPDLPEQIITAIINATAKLSDDKQLKEPKDLANLDLEDPILNDAFTKMLKGTEPEKPKSGWKHFVPEKGYLPLLNYISFDDKPQIRIYLATPPILMIIFGQEDVVNQVIKAREDLFKRVDKGEEVKTLNEDFSLYKNYRDPSIHVDLLNFEVSKTNPASAK